MTEKSRGCTGCRCGWAQGFKQCLQEHVSSLSFALICFPLCEFHSQINLSSQFQQGLQQL